jgi:hypothetical protein
MRREVAPSQAFSDPRRRARAQPRALGWFSRNKLVSGLRSRTRPCAAGGGELDVRRHHEYKVARDYVDVRIQTIFGGTTEIMKEIIGRDLGL